jgi:hypothetical protein
MVYLAFVLTPPWQYISSLFTLDGRRDMSLVKLAMYMRHRQ